MAAGIRAKPEESGKFISAATNIHEIVVDLLDTVFCMRRVKEKYGINFLSRTPYSKQ
jgi:phage baseplate assembly protein W